MVKKTRTDNPQHTASRIFHPFRALGYVTSDTPFCLQARGTEFFLIVSVGSAFHIYDCSKLHLKFVSQVTGHAAPIRKIVAIMNDAYVACGPHIVHFNQTKRVRTFQSSDASSFDITDIVAFGDHLITLDESNRMCVWDRSTGEVYSEVAFSDTFRASLIVHPTTYLNKILVASSQGSMQLWNIRTSKLIYEFPSFGAPIMTMVQTPVVDVIAIGLLDGSIILHNIRADETIMRFHQEGQVTSISFRTDELQIMASANLTGDICLWDLEKRRLSHVMKRAHESAISSAEFLNGKPILVTAGADNAIKEWVFESLDGAPRLLKCRSGHYAPPTFIRYFGDTNRHILSAGRDRCLRFFSTIRESQNVELSQGSIDRKAKLRNTTAEELKLPYPTQFAACTAKERYWDSVLTCHLNSDTAQTWSLDRKAIGQHKFKSSDGSNIKCVAISHCGNFGLIGCASGRIDMFNMQSGLHRCEFGTNETRHSKAITSLLVDNTSRRLASSSLDGTVKIWSFQTGECLETIQLESPVSLLVLHEGNDLVAIASDDCCIRILDLDTLKIARVFYGHTSRITDMTFSPDGRWVCSASMDATIRTWDLPTGNLVDILKPGVIATSLSFSPIGDYLATTHVNHNGIYMWSNKTLFTNVTLKRLDDEVEADMEVSTLPTTGGQAGEDFDESNEENGVSEEQYRSPEQISEDMITLSFEPKSKWQNLLHLDTIKKRNKPKEPIKAPEKAPFFLPTLAGLEPKFQIDVKKENNAEQQHSRILSMNDMTIETEMTRRLRETIASQTYDVFLSFLNGMTTTGIDFEIRTLPLSSVCDFLQVLLACMKQRRCFDVVQAYLNVTLKLHGDIILEDSSMRPVLVELQAMLGSEWGRVESMLQRTSCMVDFVRGAL